MLPRRELWNFFASMLKGFPPTLSYSCPVSLQQILPRRKFAPYRSTGLVYRGAAPSKAGMSMRDSLFWAGQPFRGPH
jgi:hypothetical protein